MSDATPEQDRLDGMDDAPGPDPFAPAREATER